MARLFRIRWLCMFLLLPIVASGCATPAPAQPTRMVAKERSYLSDVPVPVGFEINEQLSEDRMTGRRRLYIRHIYEGNADAYSVRNFYLEQLPRYQWQNVQAGNAKGVHTLRFEKAPEACHITISRPDGGWSGKLRIEVMIIPEGDVAPIR